MADEVTVKIEGDYKKIAEKLKWYNVVCREAVKIALQRAGFAIQTQAKDNLRALVYHAPVKGHYKRTGRLLSSISVNWSGSEMPRGKVGPKAKSEDGVGQPSGPMRLVVVVGTNVEYARRIEHGFVGVDSLGRHYNQEGRPYLYPAFFSKEGEVEKQIKEIVGRKIGK